MQDNKIQKLTNERILQKTGCSVVSAQNGEEALRLARETIPGIILVDMLLPKLGGREVMRALKEGQQTAGVPVLVFSSLPQANETKLKGEGVAGYFEKSRLVQTGNGEKELVEIIARLIQESRTGAEAAAAKAGHATG